MSGRAAALAALLLAAGAAPPALARPVCAERGEIAGWLESRYEERPLFVGTVGGRLVYEVWTSQRGTWTVLRTGPDGTACLVAAGTDGEWIVQGLGL